jgi:hypothetical protein
VWPDKVLSLHFLGGTEEIHENKITGGSAEIGTKHLQNKNVTSKSACYGFMPSHH